MRRTWCPLLVVGLTLSGPAALRADEQAEARKLIDRAIRAAGGREKLSKLQALTWKNKGTVKVNETDIPFSGEASLQGDDRYSWSVEVTLEGQVRRGVLAIKGTRGWLRAEDQPAQDMPAELFSFLRPLFLAGSLPHHLAGLQGRAWKLSPLGELAVNDRPALGVKAAREDLPEMDLFFDKETLLPVRCSVRVKNLGDKQEGTYDFLFSDYQDAEGTRQPARMALQIDGKTVLEMELSDFKPRESLDGSLFDKP